MPMQVLPLLHTRLIDSWLLIANSLSVTWYLASVGVSFILKKATGCPFCNNSAPTATSLAPGTKSILNGLELSGNFSTGAKVSRYFKVSKAYYYSAVST